MSDVHHWQPCGTGPASVIRCGVDMGHYHCTKCQCVAFPSFDNPLRLEYVAIEKGFRREWEPVPDACPAPRTHRIRRRKPLPFRVGNRWSLVRVVDSESCAQAWLYELGRALGAETYSPRSEPGDSLVIIRQRGPSWFVFARVAREHVAALEARAWRSVA